jgi:hypothetical protein
MTPVRGRADPMADDGSLCRQWAKETGESVVVISVFLAILDGPRGGARADQARSEA